MPIRICLVDRAASAPSLWGKVRQRPERLHGAPDPAAVPAPAAAAPTVRHPVRARQRVAVERPRIPQAPSPGPGVGSLARLRRRVRPGCAERVRAHLGPLRSAPRGADGRRALPPPPAGGQQPGGPALGQGAGRPSHGGGLPGVSGADRRGSRPKDPGSGRQLQDAPRPDNPRVTGGEPSRSRFVFSAGLLAASQSYGIARGLGPAAGPSRAEQDRSPASRQPGSCFPVFARSSGAGASLLSRGSLQVYSCLNSDGTNFGTTSINMDIRTIFSFLRLSDNQKYTVRKKAIRRLKDGESMVEVAASSSVATRTVKRWIARYALGGFGNLQDRQRTGRSRQGIAEHADWIYAVVVDKTPSRARSSVRWGPRSGSARSGWTGAVSHSASARGCGGSGSLRSGPSAGSCRSGLCHGRRWQEREFPAIAQCV